MDLYLHSVIYQILADLESASVHYIIYSRYFFFGQQMFCYEVLHIHKDLVREVNLSENSLSCRMRLDAVSLDDVYSIVIPFDYIREIIRVCKDTMKVNKHCFESLP